MNDYIPFVVLAIFGIASCVGTIVWTEHLFPEKDSQEPTVEQREFNFKKAEEKQKIQS
jgi:hypothetical protein